ncbi:MAG: sulfatase-like hydrolase/transferase, partial [Pseudomonadota bacterium]
MIKNILIGLVVVILGAGLLVWFNRGTILTNIALNRASANQVEVSPYQAIEWQKGPAEADTLVSERAPNIVFILLDDFGYNDLSTFGGGVAGGAVPTPNIDRLAAEGAIYSQAYSGTGTCAPSRAMLLTGRYPTRTGFEFTPTPDGMSTVLATIANSADRGALPDMYLNTNIDEDALPFQDQGLPGSEITIAELLQEQDYHTVHIGKWHLGRRTDFMPNAQGFDESLLMHSGLFLAEDDPNV